MSKLDNKSQIRFKVNKIINPFPIDAVVTWVDGNDIHHKEKMFRFIDEKQMSIKDFKLRYRQINEIKFCLDSLIKFAPYLRKIFLITDEQKPDFLNLEIDPKYKKVVIVDHKEIFSGYHDYLPTFSSLSIESCLHRMRDWQSISYI